MDHLIIEPGVGVGNFKLGMTGDQINKCIEAYIGEYESDQPSYNYLFRSCVMPEYDNEDKVISITITRDLISRVNFRFHEVDVFHTKADDLIPYIDHISPYVRRSEMNYGYDYYFTEIGLSFYRSSVMTDDVLEEDWFKAQSPENQAYQMKYYYFESFLVCGTNYYDHCFKDRVQLTLNEPYPGFI